MGELSERDMDLLRPIVGIQNRTAQEVFDIMCDRFRRPRTEGRGESVAWTNKLGLEKLKEAPKEASWMWGTPNGSINIALYASPIREPEISREVWVERAARIINPKAFERQAQWADGPNFNVTTAAIEENNQLVSRAKSTADAILNLAPVGVIAETPNNPLCAAPVGGRGEEWRPISEAPRDGSPILAASTNHEAREVVCWQDGEDSGSLDADAVCEGWVNAGEQKDRFYANPRWFTHWQPLPPPPQEQKEGSARADLSPASRSPDQHSAGGEG